MVPALQMHTYHYISWHAPYTNDYAFTCAIGESDDAVEPLIRYIIALESFFTPMVGDYITTVIALAHTRASFVPHASEFHLTIIPRAIFGPPLSFSSPTFAACRGQRTSTSEEYHRYFALTPVRAASPTRTLTPLLDFQSSATPLETISEAESSSPPLRLTLGDAAKTPDAPNQ